MILDVLEKEIVESEPFKRLKESEELVPDKHDGSYELVRTAIDFFKSVPNEQVDYKDLDAIWCLTIGTWKFGIDAKKRKIVESHLPEVSKNTLYRLLDEKMQEARSGKYSNSPHFGMFGTGFGTFKSSATYAVAQNFIEMCIDISETKDHYKKLEIAQSVIEKGLKGIGISSLSTILHCLEPDVFPIINGKEGEGTKLYKSLGIELIRNHDINCYIENTRRITEFRDTHFKFKNFRVMDLVKAPCDKKDKSIEVEMISETQQMYSDNNTPSQRRKYWTFSPGANASEWEEQYSKGIMAVDFSDEIGDLSVFESKDEIRSKLIESDGRTGSRKNDTTACWDISRRINVGDIVFAKAGRSKVVGRGVIVRDYYFDSSRQSYKSCLGVHWTEKGEWNFKGFTIKTLTEITKYKPFVNALEALFGIETPFEIETPFKVETPFEMDYSREEFLNDVYMHDNNYDKLVDLLNHKKNIILQGSPGVGKTFAAKRLAYSIMGMKDSSRVEVIQFHQSYSYEDFIIGYRPTKDGGFELVSGAFYDFCEKAKNDLENDYFFIIDEINRGNLSKIFGELFMLIEKDKRGEVVRLLYGNDEMFTIPNNLYVIGMMNTADRSLAMLDYALRRRFGFFEMEPAFDHEHFAEKSEQNETFAKLISQIKRLNNEIQEDDSLGDGFRIGHSYFCGDDLTAEKLNAIVEFEIIPLIKEYWFDEKEKVEEWETKLRGAVNG